MKKKEDDIVFLPEWYGENTKPPHPFVRPPVDWKAAIVAVLFTTAVIEWAWIALNILTHHHWRK